MTTPLDPASDATGDTLPPTLPAEDGATPGSAAFADASLVAQPSDGSTVPTDEFSPPPPPTVRFSPPSKGVPRGLVAVLAPVLAIVMFVGGLVSGQVLSPAATSGPPAAASGAPYPSSADAELALIVQAWHDLQDNYVDASTLDNQALAYAAISAMTTAVGDTGHTVFFTAAQSKAMDQSLSGTFVGIGVQVVSVDATANTGLKVSVVISNTPAEAAGLKRGDIVVAVDGKTTAGETTDAIVASIRGPEGTSVKLTVQRAGVPTFDISIVRRKFDLPLASWAMVPGQTVAVIRLDSFATGAGKAVADDITAAQKAGATGIILDLRGNPGGYVNEAIAVASQFVPDGVVYQSIDRSGQTTNNNVTPGGLWTTGPLVVLANADTASAAEIVTGAIKDSGRGKVVGVTTFGTGTVLGRFDLPDGSMLRIGIERWLTRNGTPIWHEGITPDVAVPLPTTATEMFPTDFQDLTAAQLAATTDAQLLKALEVIKTAQ